MSERRFRRGDRVDFNNSRDPLTPAPNGTPGRVRRVIITRKYVVSWEDGYGDDDAPYEPSELVPLEGAN